MRSTLIFPTASEAKAAMPKDGTEAQQRLLHRAAEEIMAAASAGRKEIKLVLFTDNEPRLDSTEQAEVISFLQLKGFKVTTGYTGVASDYQHTSINTLTISWATHSPLTNTGSGNGFYDR